MRADSVLVAHPDLFETLQRAACRDRRRRHLSDPAPVRAPACPRGRIDGGNGAVGTRILSVEDDERIRTAVKLALEDEGWTVDEAGSGEEAIELFTRATPDVVLIDIMLPGIDGFELCRTLRRTSDVPDRDGHRPQRHPRRRRRARGRRRRLPHQAVRARRSCRPASVRCCAASAPSAPATPSSCSATSRSCPTRARSPAAATELHLTKTEFRLLCELAQNPGRVFSRESLLDKVWGYDYFGDGRLVDVHVRRLRTKVEADPANPRHVVTVRGLGYRLQS